MFILSFFSSFLSLFFSESVYERRICSFRTGFLFLLLSSTELARHQLTSSASSAAFAVSHLKHLERTDAAAAAATNAAAAAFPASPAASCFFLRS